MEIPKIKERNVLTHKPLELWKPVSPILHWFIRDTIKLYFSFSSLLSVNDESILYFKKYFYFFAPFEVTLAFCDQGSEFSKIIWSSLTRPTQMWSQLFIPRLRSSTYTASAAASNSTFAFLRRFLRCVTSLTEPHNLQRFPLSHEEASSYSKKHSTHVFSIAVKRIPFQKSSRTCMNYQRTLLWMFCVLLTDIPNTSGYRTLHRVGT